MNWGLDFWKSAEWQKCDERLKDMERNGVDYNPSRDLLFHSLSSVGGPEDVNVVLVGQDPYPVRTFATGLAFSIPSQYERKDFPPTLREIFGEYSRDLRYPIPSHGDLSRWVKQGVLLWNVVPVTRTGISLGCDWEEWRALNNEMFRLLSQKGIVFCFLGGVARSYAGVISSNNRVIQTSHPSPRGSLNSKTPFRGSRIFSTINRHLNELGLDPIDWRLDEATRPKAVQKTSMDGGSILPNITGVDLGGRPRHPQPNLYVPST